MTGRTVERPLVSIIIPSYNEERDILACLGSVLALTYEHKEVIAIDSSRDRTPELLRPYAEAGAIRLVRSDRRLNVATARNRGIQLAKGDVLVLLNADVVLDPDFLERILLHYRRGADFVVCESQVANTEQLIPAFLQAVHALELGSRNDLVWSEGWSCRRSVFERAGLFNEAFPAASGEDAAFGFSLLRQGFRRVQDHAIVVRHIVPDTLSGFTRQMVGRGRGEYYFDVLHARKDPGSAVRLILRPWILVLVLFGGMFFYPIGTAVSALGALIATGRALRSGLRLAQMAGRVSRTIPFAALHIVRFRSIECGYLSAYWRANIVDGGASRTPTNSAGGRTRGEDTCITGS